MPSKASPPRGAVEAQNRRFRELKQQLAQVEFFAKGTVLARMVKCGKRQCACNAERSKRHGPYYEWTYKVDGKTVNVHLTAESAPLYQAAAKQYKKLKKLLAQMEKASRQALARLATKADRAAS